MSQYIYVLEGLHDGWRYVGMTKNIQNRIKQHNNGMAKSTRFHRPYKLVYSECFDTYKEAYHREKYFKTGKGREELKKILCG